MATGAIIGAIGVAASVAGTASQISQANAAARRQNAAIEDQRAAIQANENVRMMQARTQAQIIEQQFALQQSQIRGDAQLERMALRNQRYENNAQAALARRQNQMQLLALRNQIQNQRNQLQSASRDTKNATDEMRGQALAQASQMVAQLGDPTQDIVQLNNQVAAQAAQVKAMSGSRGRTSKMQGKLTPEQIAFVANQLMNQRGISAEAAQAVASSDQMATIINNLTNVQLAMQDRALASTERNAGRQSRVVGRMVNQDRRSTANSLNNAIQQNQVAERQQMLQAEENRDFALGSLITGQALGAAQSVAEQAQLRANRRSGVSGLESIAALAQSALPGVGQIIASNQNPQSTIGRVPAYGTAASGLSGVTGATVGLMGSKDWASAYNTVPTQTPNIGRAGIVGGMTPTSAQAANLPTKSFYSIPLR